MQQLLDGPLDFSYIPASPKINNYWVYLSQILFVLSSFFVEYSA